MQNLSFPTDGFWTENVQAGEVVYPPGSKFGPRIQANLQLVLLHSGHMTLWLDGLPRPVPTHHVCILFPGHEERFVFAEDCETHHSYIHAAIPHFSQTLLDRLERISWPLQLSPSMLQLIRDALHIQATPFPTSQDLLRSIVSQMFWRYLGEGEQLLTHSVHSLHPAVEQSQSFILNHLSEPITLESLASHVAVSPPHLIRLFQSQLHTTPMNYLWERRVARAVELLEQTGLPVGTIAERCGFQSRYHFSRKVRLLVGYSPLEIRQRSWQRKQ